MGEHRLEEERLCVSLTASMHLTVHGNILYVLVLVHGEIDESIDQSECQSQLIIHSIGRFNPSGSFAGLAFTTTPHAR